MSAPTVQELREALLAAGDRMRELRERPAEQRSANWSADIRTTRDEIYALDAELSVIERQGRGAFGFGNPAGTGDMSFGVERRSTGELVVADESMLQWLQRSRRGTSPDVVVERRNLLNTVTSGEGDDLLPVGQPTMPSQTIVRRRLFVRDVIAGGSTTLNSVPFIKELNATAYETGAAFTAEASAKPEVTMKFTNSDAPVRTVAAWIPVTNQILEDVPTLRSYIDGRLTYMVQLREEEAILSGDGISPNLEGILTQSDLQTQSFDTDKVTTIGLAIGKIELVDGEADAVAINPLTFWTMVTSRHANQFDGGFVSQGAPFGAPATTVWGLPAIRTRAITQNRALVGSWRMGAQVFDRSTITIRVTDSHSDLFVKNQTVILAESRLALAVHRPDFFCYATLS